MALTPKLDQRQSQFLVLTPRLRQAIKLLQLSNLELQDYVEQELEQNPLLAREDVETGSEGEEADDRASPGRTADRLEETTARGEPALPDAVEFSAAETLLEREENFAADYENLWDDEANAEAGFAGGDAFIVWGNGGGPDFAEARGFENTLSGKVGLLEHLTRQLHLEVEDAVDRAIGMQLIDLVDEAGYLPVTLSPIAERLNCDLVRIEQTLRRLQEFDPPGVFARSLSECLALQLQDRDRLDPAMRALVDHLDLVARRDIPALKRICGVDDEDLAEMVAELRTLDPKPGLAFDLTLAQPVTPDIFVRPRRGGGWHVELNNETLPRVLVNTRYYAEVSRKAKTESVKDYLTERLQSANWLAKSLHQRMTTILKVASEIVRQQEAFLAKGVQHLKPLVLRDIAGAIGMHESTVSRATTNKFMATPRGVYELKYFFSSAIPGSGAGETHSAKAVRSRIHELIQNESANDILSDDRLVGLLKNAGIHIARRTVAKYREALRLPSSVQRRREKSRRF